jgi:hypothetical protein
VLKQAARLSGDSRVLFAALTHDLGKGVTPAHILPGHRGHESAGLPLVRPSASASRSQTRTASWRSRFANTI